MIDIDTKFKRLRGEFQTEEDQVRISGWEKSIRKFVLTSKLKDNDAFKLIISKYEAEREKLRNTLSEDVSLFKDGDAIILGRLIHERIKFINEFFAIFSTAEMNAKAIDNTIDRALGDNGTS